MKQRQARRVFRRALNPLVGARGGAPLVEECVMHHIHVRRTTPLVAARELARTSPGSNGLVETITELVLLQLKQTSPYSGLSARIRYDVAHRMRALSLTRVSLARMACVSEWSVPAGP